MDKLTKTQTDEDEYDKYSIWCCWKVNPLRRILVWLNENVWFDRMVIFFIFLNSISLAMYEYGDSDNPALGNPKSSAEVKNNYLDTIGIFFTVFFTIECGIKIIAMGFIMHKNAYLRDGWNWIDFFVVVISLIE